MSTAYKKLNMPFYHSLFQKKSDLAEHMTCQLLALYGRQQIYFFIFMFFFICNPPPKVFVRSNKFAKGYRKHS